MSQPDLVLSIACNGGKGVEGSHHQLVSAGITSSRCINACLAPIASLDGCSIVTVEGLGSCSSGFNPVQGMAALGDAIQPLKPCWHLPVHVVQAGTDAEGMSPDSEGNSFRRKCHGCVLVWQQIGSA